MKRNLRQRTAIRVWKVFKWNKKRVLSELLIDEIIDRKNISMREALEYAHKKAMEMEIGTDFFCAVYVKNVAH